ncbi:MAG: hypothetical protein ACKO1U_10500 [Bacteroidota bacterium]
MRRIILSALLSFCCISSPIFLSAQPVESVYKETKPFRYHLSGTFNPFNPKLTAQLELPIKTRMSYGVAMSYYFINWEGPMAQPFLRLYGKRKGNAMGSFLQFKLMYGYLTTLDYEDYNGALLNERWHTFGVGLAYGYKFRVNDYLTIEPMVGVRLLTPPYYIYDENVDESLYASIAEGVVWYITSGSPLDLSVKLGVQF